MDVLYGHFNNTVFFLNSQGVLLHISNVIFNSASIHIKVTFLTALRRFFPVQTLLNLQNSLIKSLIPATIFRVVGRIVERIVGRIVERIDKFALILYRR